MKKNIRNNYDNDLFINIVKISKENSETGELIRDILDLDDVKRIALISEIVDNMRKNDEEQKLIEAFVLLKSREIVNKIKQIKI